jgi:cobyrinic acid a,c-diamide synthase
LNEAGSMPRLLVAGLSGGSGKTVVSMGLLLLLKKNGVEVRAFKKGPDYIDTGWLRWASGHVARNLDTYLMGADGVRASLVRHGIRSGINLIEGNRGLFDGFDAAGTHSSAALAQTLGAPVLLVVDAAKMTRTAAALVLGCQKLDPSLAIRGVILNNVNGKRHEQLLRDTIESACGAPIVGVLPRTAVNLLPERHLGLVPPQERNQALNEIEQHLLELVEGRFAIDAIMAIAQSAPGLVWREPQHTALDDGHGLRIGYIEDAAFSFYYPENLEALRQSGADLVATSALATHNLPDGLHALYIGGGFPETHAAALSANRGFLESLRLASKAGLPVYAECGGLMLLARTVLWNGERFAMAGALPIDIEVCKRPVGHGYAELRVDTPNPFFAPGSILRGHEFHYSRIVGEPEIPTGCAVLRGTGCLPGRDGIIVHNIFAGYTHLHAAGEPRWAPALVAAARKYGERSDCGAACNFAAS